MSKKELVIVLNKKHLIIGGIILLIFVFFGIRSYLLIEKQNSKFQSVENQIDPVIETVEDANEISETFSNNVIDFKSNIFSGQKVFKYSSEFYDIERLDGSTITNREITYHTFDFNKNTVTNSSILNGKRVIITYPFNGMYEEKGILATTYVLNVNTLGVKEIWWSPDVPNLGYDYDDGTRIACYNLKIKTN